VVVRVDALADGEPAVDGPSHDPSLATFRHHWSEYR
jgi:hypothetical protein